MHQALGQSHGLYMEDFLTTLLHAARLRNERSGIYLALQNKIARRDRMGLNIHYRLMDHPPLRIDKRGVEATLCTQSLHIDLCYLHLLIEGKPFASAQALAILINHRIASIDHVLRTLAKAGTGIHITGDGTRALLGNELT